MMKEVHAERGGAIVLACIVLMSMIGGMLFKDKEETATDYSIMLFPAYYTENPEKSEDIDKINSAMPFYCKVDWPQGWTVSEDKGDVSWPAGRLYTPLYIYDENSSPVGYIGFNIFTPADGEVSDSEYHKTVWAPLRNSSEYRWDPFTPVLTGFTSQIGIIDIEYTDSSTGNTVTTNGIMAYDTGVRSYIGIAFMPGVMTRDDVIELSKTVRVYAV